MGNDPFAALNQRDRGGVVLGHSRAAQYRPVAGRNPFLAMGATLSAAQKQDLDTAYRLPGFGTIINVVVFRTKAAINVNAYFKELRDKAQTVFRPHGIQLSVRDLTLVPLAHVDGPVTTDEDIDQAIQHVQDAGDPRWNLKVIFCTRQTGTSTVPPGEAGVTVRDRNHTPYILINTQTSSPDRVTLAHEIGHACGLHHELDQLRTKYGAMVDVYLNSHHIRGNDNFMSDSNWTTRCDLFAFQVKAMSIAPFANPALD